MTRRLRAQRLQWQLLFILIAGISVAALSVLLVSDAVHSAERVVLADTGNTLAGALSELKQQYRDRVAQDTGWAGLPSSAQDVSLRGVSQAVLRSFPGVEGGYYANGQFLGYSFPTHDTGEKTDVPVAEKSTIQAVIARALAGGEARQMIRGQHDLVVIEARAVSPEGQVSWAMKRLAGRNEPGANGRAWLMAALVLAALISVIGTLTTAVTLHRGITGVQQGLAALETDFTYQLPERRDELGEISRSINRMAFTRRRLESELRREDRLRAMGRLVAGIAHEIRNPLNSIRLAMELLEKRLHRNQIQPQDLRLVRDEVDRLNALLTGLLTFQQTKPPQLETQALTPLIERSIELLRPQAAGRGVELSTVNIGPPVTASCDAQQFKQALMNLLLNAVEATPGPGNVEVSARMNGQSVEVAVSDHGPGIAPEQRERLFEAFYTTKPNGTGLGLAVSRELIQAMGGRVRYEEAHPGATFVIELPV